MRSTHRGIAKHKVSDRRGQGQVSASPLAARPLDAGVMRRLHAGAAWLRPTDVTQLQRTIGNRAVRRLLDDPPGNKLVGGSSGLSLRPAAAPGLVAVQRKLAGAREALEAMGGGASKKSKAKAKLTFRQKSKKKAGAGKYAALLNSLQNYEQLEAKMAAQGRELSSKQMQELIDRFHRMVTAAEGWLEQHKEYAQDPDVVKSRMLKNEKAEKLESEETASQRRYHAVKLLLVRLRHEQREILQGKFHETKSWSDATLDAEQSRDDAFGGQVNRLDVVKHAGDETPGVFIWDRPYDDAATAGKDLGIPDVDPMAGARSVAMYQLAKLLDFDINVIAPTEFATHKSATKKEGAPMAEPMAKFGVRMEMAKGQEAAATPTAMTAAERQGDEISLEDPILQRSLNALQLIDAIAGQLDRHWHNYYIATEGGRVTGVVGIDLDMAFAVDHRGTEPVPVDRTGRPVTKANFVGMPALVDRAFAERILAIDLGALRSMLATYLTPAEVESTIQRFLLVSDAVKDIMGTDKIVSDWNADTAAQQRDAATSYLGKMQEGIIGHKFASEATDALYELFDRTGLGQHMNTKKGIPRLVNQLAEIMKTGQLTIQDGSLLIQKLNQLVEASPSINRNLERMRQMEARGAAQAQPLMEQLAAAKQRKRELESRDISDPERVATSRRAQELQAAVNSAKEGDPMFKNNLRADVMAWVAKTALALARKPVGTWDNFRPQPIPKQPMQNEPLVE